ncbi:MAG: TrkH family potassium uptake protein [Bacteroidota bacterium]
MLKKLTPVQTLLLGYIALILVGALLLSLPFSSSKNQYTPFIDTLFTATSAVSTTGLGVVDTGTHFSLTGQIIILVLFQIGGLGYMIFIALISLGVGSRFSISSRKLLTESMARPTSIEIKKFVKAVIFFTFAFELFGAIVLTVIFLQKMPVVDAVYSAVFHSVSGFCTAGFSLYSDSFTAYSFDMLANVVIAIITIAGGIGFFVLYDVAKYFSNIFKRRNPFKLTVHSKLVLTVSFFLMTIGTIVIFFLEAANTTTSLADRLLTASFQALSASTTTGFNTIDIGKMYQLSLVVIILLMFIGASPGSTGGGIKTSTFGIIVLFIKKVITNRQEVHVFRRSIDDTTVNKALGITLIGVFYMVFVVVILSLTEKFSLLQIIFEATSALGTVGLSMGITSQLTFIGKALIILTMLIGRVGPLAIGYSLIGKVKTQNFSYPSGNVMTG